MFDTRLAKELISVFLENVTGGWSRADLSMNHFKLSPVPYPIFIFRVLDVLESGVGRGLNALI